MSEREVAHGRVVRKQNDESSCVPKAVRLQLLGRFVLDRGGSPADLPEGTQRLLALLGLRGGGRRTSVADLLWPGVEERCGLARLRTALWRLPKHMRIVELRGQVLALAPTVCVDVAELSCRIARILTEPNDQDGEDLLAGPFPGELLPGWYDDWVLYERERLRQLQLHALETLSSSLLERGRFGEALEAGLRAVWADPLRESARRRVIAVHLAEDNLVDAVRHYEGFVAVLRDELGVGPSAELQTLVRRAVVERDRCGSADSSAAGVARVITDLVRGRT